MLSLYVVQIVAAAVVVVVVVVVIVVVVVKCQRCFNLAISDDYNKYNDNYLVHSKHD